MAEWSMAVVLKTTEPETVPGVRIPLPPPEKAYLLSNFGFLEKRPSSYPLFKGRLETRFVPDIQ
jgi:hypothetical protein